MSAESRDPETEGDESTGPSGQNSRGWTSEVSVCTNWYELGTASMHIRLQAPPFLSAVSAAHSYPAGLFKSTVGMRTSTVRLLGRVTGSVSINSPRRARQAPPAPCPPA